MARTTEDSSPDPQSTATGSLVHAFLNPYLPTEQLRNLAERMLSREDLAESIPPERMQEVVDKLNQVHHHPDYQSFLPSVSLNTAFAKVYITVLAEDKGFLLPFGNFCSDIGQFPVSAVLSAELVKCDTNPTGSGGLTDVWRGKHGDDLVAIKAFRACSIQNPEVEKALRKLVPMLTKLTHPNIAPFRGVSVNAEDFRLALVYDWGEQDNIIRFTKLHPEIPRLALLLQVAIGLQYLHSLGILHGNLKGANVLIDASGTAWLTDYGLALVNSIPNPVLDSRAVANSRWLAPEIFDPGPDTDKVAASKPADIFAFAMLVFQVFTGERPFEGCNDARAATRILRGDRPVFPQTAEDLGLTEQLWEFLRRCWHRDPLQRPTIDKVVRALNGFLGNDEYAQEPSNDGGCGGFAPSADGLPVEPQPAEEANDEYPAGCLELEEVPRTPDLDDVQELQPDGHSRTQFSDGDQSPSTEPSPSPETGGQSTRSNARKPKTKLWKRLFCGVA